MCWIAVVFNVFPASRIGQSVFVLGTNLLHDSSHGFVLLFFTGCLKGAEDRRRDLSGWQTAGESDKVW